MNKHLAVFTCILFVLGLNNCASRALLKDEAGKPITKAEVDAEKNHQNLFLFALGGGALSFGASFFIGSMADRKYGETDNTALWAVTGIGTAAGLVYFAYQGNIRDYNVAVEKVKEKRRKEAAARLSQEKQRRRRIELEKQRLLKERQRQEAEKQKIIESLKKKQEKP